jgi:hypothetical protein
MAKIGTRTIESSIHMIEGLLMQYQEELTSAYLKCDGTLNISISLKVKPDPKGNNVKASVSFTKEKVAAEAEDIVDDDQISLFQEEAKVQTDNAGNTIADTTGDDALILKII